MDKKQQPRGIINNNPLNIRYVEKNKWKGRVRWKKDNSFEEFINMMYGYRAAFILISKYMTLYCLRTPFQICARWAPVGDGNRPYEYAKFVCNRMGCGLNDELCFIDPSQMIKLASAMTEMENGSTVEWTKIRDGYVEAATYLGFYNAAVSAQQMTSIEG